MSNYAYLAMFLHEPVKTETEATAVFESKYAHITKLDRHFRQTNRQRQRKRQRDPLLWSKFPCHVRPAPKLRLAAGLTKVVSPEMVTLSWTAGVEISSNLLVQNHQRAVRPYKSS